VYSEDSISPSNIIIGLLIGLYCDQFRPECFESLISLSVLLTEPFNAATCGARQGQMKIAAGVAVNAILFDGSDDLVQIANRWSTEFLV
jgi:hypothetical protein